MTGCRSQPQSGEPFPARSRNHPDRRRIVAEPKGNLRLYEESMKDNHKGGSCHSRLMGRRRQQGVRLHLPQAPPPGGGALRAGRVLEEEPRNQKGAYPEGRPET